MNWIDVKWYVKCVATRSEVGALWWSRLVSRNRGLLVTERTDVVIEGFPRSGNTFCVALVQLLSIGHVRIARHRHEIGQIKRAIRLGKPIIILLRHPKDAVSSFMIRERVSAAFALQYYIEYYTFILSVRRKVCLVEFTKMVNEPECVTSQIVSMSSQCSFRPYSPSDLSLVNGKVIEMEVEDSGGGAIRSTHVALPTQDRELAKVRLIGSLKEGHRRLYQQAQEIYARLSGI